MALIRIITTDPRRVAASGAFPDDVEFIGVSDLSQPPPPLDEALETAPDQVFASAAGMVAPHSRWADIDKWPPDWVGSPQQAAAYAEAIRETIPRARLAFGVSDIDLLADRSLADVFDVASDLGAGADVVVDLGE